MSKIKKMLEEFEIIYYFETIYLTISETPSRIVQMIRGINK